MERSDKIAFGFLIGSLLFLICHTAVALSRHAQALGIHWR